MNSAFYLLDLPSQVLAVQQLLKGHIADEKLSWIAARGELSQVPTEIPNARPIYRFVSSIAMECLFFIDGDEFVLIGDHTVYKIREDSST